MTELAPWYLSKTAITVYIVLGIVAAIVGYGQWKDWKARQDVKKDVKIEKLEGSNKALVDATKVRSKQNEVLVRDITPDAFSSILQQGQF